MCACVHVCVHARVHVCVHMCMSKHNEFQISDLTLPVKNNFLLRLCIRSEDMELTGVTIMWILLTDQKYQEIHFTALSEQKCLDLFHGLD